MPDFQPPSDSNPNPSSSPSPSPNPDLKKPVLCEECRENKWKYRCPGCGLLTCSLPCVKSHKERLSCTGKRPRTEFIPISQFDDKTLLSDYNFLEEAKRVAEAASRIRTGLGGNYYSYLPHTLHILRRAAAQRGISLFFLPKGMTKRESNRSHFHQRKKCIYWTIEWRFHSAHSTLIDHDVPETERLEKLIEKHLFPTPWNDNLTPYRKVPLSELRFFIQKRAKTSRSQFREVDIKLPLRSQLKSVLILEHPVIHVYIPTDTPDFDIEKRVTPEVSKDRDTGPLNQERGLLAGDPAAKCNIYKEEEIEEGEMESETHVVDLNEHAAQNSKFSGEPSIQNFNTVESPAKGGKVPNSREDMIEVKEEGFDFDQEVKRAYNDLMGEMNPDDFLCFDDEGFINNVHNYENKALTVGEEIQEGQIPA